MPQTETEITPGTEPEAALPPEPPIQAARPPFLTVPESSKYPFKKIAAGALGSLLLLGLAVGAVYLGFSVSHALDAVADSQKSLARSVGQQISEVSKGSNEQFTKAAKIAGTATETAASALESARDVSARLSGISSRLETTRGQISKLDERLATLEKSSHGPVPRMEIAAPPPEPNVTAPAPKQPSHKPLAMDPHHHDIDPDAHPPAGTVVIDGHWLVINPETHRQAELIPYAHNASGTMVHSIPDGKHYLINRAGGWIGQVQE